MPSNSAPLKEIYTTLKRAYGKQNWWPTTPRGKLHPEYRGGPQNKREQLEVIVGSILTQNTAWKNVEKAIYQLNKRQLIELEQLRRMPVKRLAALIRSSGYFNEKAKKLKEMAQFLSAFGMDDLARMQVEPLRRVLLGLYGVGPETADSIILYAFNKPVFVIDAYTKRIFSRLGLAAPDARYEELQRLCHGELRKNPQVYNEFHALLVVHAKTVCTKKPRCGECVLREVCRKLL